MCGDGDDEQLLCVLFGEDDGGAAAAESPVRLGFAPRSEAPSPRARLVLFLLFVVCCSATNHARLHRGDEPPVSSRTSCNPPLPIPAIRYAQARLGKFRNIGRAAHNGTASIAWAKWTRATRRLRAVRRTQDVILRAFRSKVSKV